jgi:hypothetical protein
MLPAVRDEELARDLSADEDEHEVADREAAPLQIRGEHVGRLVPFPLSLKQVRTH